jgi:hypothetical protein
MPPTCRNALSVFLAGLLLSQTVGTRVYAQEPPPSKLNLVILEGDGAINNIRQRVAREPVVQVEDENHKPIAGAAVVFLLPNQGAGGAFANGARSLTVLTDAQGKAVMRGLVPNKLQGNFQVRVTASFRGQTASTNINMSNAAGAAAGAGAGAGSGKLIVILAAVGGAAAAGIAIGVTRGGGGSTPVPTPAATIITPGNPSVGPPR